MTAAQENAAIHAVLSEYFPPLTTVRAEVLAMARDIVQLRAQLAMYRALPVTDWSTDGAPVCLVPFSAYQLANLAALCEALQYTPHWWNTGDWMICLRDRLPRAARTYATGYAPNRAPETLHAALQDEVRTQLFNTTL